MPIQSFAFPHGLSDVRRWAIALLAALAVALSAAAAAHAAPIPAVDCTGTPASQAAPRTFDLYAAAGAAPLALPDGSSTPFLGYTSDGSAPTLPGGPVLAACAGDYVQITLHNTLAGASSLAVHGQAEVGGALAADQTGAAPGGTAVYTFKAHAGTFLYQAGLTAGGPAQAAMGLYGALVVYPAGPAGKAYDEADGRTAFDAQEVVLVSEIDPALNADPANFDMRAYAPKFGLINGQAYPDTPALSGPAGQKLLVRYLNAGFEEHSMALLGLDQSIVAANGFLAPFAHRVVAETVMPGGTLDAVLAMPADGQYALYDANQTLDNNGATNAAGTALGGMLTFISPSVALAAAAAPPVDTAPANTAPVVTAGGDAAVTQPAAANLTGSFTDDGLPNPPGAVTTQWSQVSGPGTAVFADAAALNTTVTFDVAGDYVLRLTADDGALSGSADVAITVSPAAAVKPAAGPAQADRSRHSAVQSLAAKTTLSRL